MYFHLHTPAYMYTHFQRELQEPHTKRRRPQKRNCARKSCPTLSTSLSFFVSRCPSFSFASLSLCRSLRLSVCECVSVFFSLSLLLSLSLSRARSLSRSISVSLPVSLCLCTVLKRCTPESSKLSPHKKIPKKAPRPYICSFLCVQ